MILVLAIILFIIFLIYSIRPRKSEEYTLEGLKLSWKNDASIEGGVMKWIVTLKDSSGSVIHSYENNESKNLKNFTDVSMNIVDKKEFDDKIIGNNTLELYYNEVKPDTKLYTKTVTFTQDDFGMTLDTSNLEEIDIPEPETFTYELIMNKKNPYLGIHIEYIKLDGVLATKAQTTIHKNPNRNNKPDNMFSIGSGTENYSSWNANGHNVGDKIFTIVSNKKVDKMDIVYTRPQYAPGWIIKENGVTKITETSNRGYIANPRPVVYTYDIKNGKSTRNTSGGFKWYYYEGPSPNWYFSTPSSFDNKKPSNEGTGVTDFSNINKATNGVLQVNGKDHYAVRWQGRFVPKKDGSHEFWTKSDDMSYLYVNNDKVVDNGGLHGEKEKNGTVIMEKGREYLIEIFFSEKGGGDNIIVNFKEPNGTKTTNFSGYMVKDTNSYLYYGGDSNLGRDGRNACNMTDDDRKYACDNDSELVGIGSGNTCGHKFYKTDQGTGSTISSTDEYTKFYSCEIERRRFGGP
jgi:fibro-slime domain-containing protein